MPPGPPGLPLIGHFLEARKGPLAMFERHRKQYGDTVAFKFGPYNFVLINDPQDIRHVLVKNHANYHKSPTYNLLRPTLGNGLLTSEGSFWRRQRKLAQPAFHHKSLRNFADTMTRMAVELADDWERSPRGIDAHAAMMEVTLRVVGQTLLSTEFGGDAGAIGKAVTTVVDFVSKNEALLLLPDWVPTLGRFRERRAVAVLDKIVFKLIDERRQSNAEHLDLLAMLMSATDEETGEGMTNKQLRDEVMTMILAGHETTANALSWTLYLLAQHPEIVTKLNAELDAVLEGRPPTLDDLSSLEYTECVIKEAMRIYPPVWIVEREALGDDRLRSATIEKGTVVAVSPWTLHRDERVFPDPERFDPERFRPAAAAGRDRYSYLPFSTGPRTCIGNAFALMEAKIILAVLAQRFRIKLRPGQRIEPDPGVTLRPKPGIWVDVIARNK